jgi:hypothetical protein
MERTAPPEEREGDGRARRGHGAAAVQGAVIGPASKLERFGNPEGRVRKGVSRVTLTGDSPSAHPAREVVGVKAASWW